MRFQQVLSVFKPDLKGVSEWLTREELQQAGVLSHKTNGLFRHGVAFGRPEFKWLKEPQRGPIKNKKLHGVWVSYSPEGKKVSQGTFKKGKKTGKWFFWNEEGLIEADFNENKLVSAVSWDKGKILADN